MVRWLLLEKVKTYILIFCQELDWSFFVEKERVNPLDVFNRNFSALPFPANLEIKILLKTFCKEGCHDVIFFVHSRPRFKSWRFQFKKIGMSFLGFWCYVYAQSNETCGGLEATALFNGIFFCWAFDLKWYHCVEEIQALNSHKKTLKQKYKHEEYPPVRKTGVDAVHESCPQRSNMWKDCNL